MSSCVCIFFELHQGSAWEIQMHTWFRTSCHKYLRLQMGGFALVDLPVRMLTQDACKRPLYLHICIPASDGKCVQLSMKKLFRLVLCPRHHFFSISFFSIFLWMQKGIPQRLHHHHVPPHPTPLWFWVGIDRGNWSLWALQPHPTVSWTESPLRRQLLGHHRQAKRKRERERNSVAANH